MISEMMSSGVRRNRTYNCEMWFVSDLCETHKDEGMVARFIYKRECNAAFQAVRGTWSDDGNSETQPLSFQLGSGT